MYAAIACVGFGLYGWLFAGITYFWAGMIAAFLMFLISAVNNVPTIPKNNTYSTKWVPADETERPLIINQSNEPEPDHQDEWQPPSTPPPDEQQTTENPFLKGGKQSA
jgi:hypothetical protein